MVDRFRMGFGISPALASVTPVLALGLAVVAGISLGAGDQRVGLFPWLIAAAAGCLVVCCLGLVSVHAPDQPSSLLIGGGWSVLAFLGIAGAFVAIGVGDLLDIADSFTGVLAAVPVMLAGFGFLSMAPALITFGLGVNKADRFPKWGVWALVLVGLLVPATLLLAGAAPDDLENLVPGVGLGLLAMGWVIVGLAIRQTTRT